MHPEGYVNVGAPTTTGGVASYANFEYIYQYKDHLGNVRLSYLKNAVTGDLQVVEEGNYYAFGMKHAGYNNAITGLGNATAQKLRYNGMELEESLGAGLYEMDYRQYDPAIGKFNSIDVLAEETYSESPYHFGYNNPVYWADPTGLSGVSPMFEAMWNLTPEGTNSRWYNKGDGVFAGNAGGKEIDLDSGSLVYYVYDIQQNLPELDITISRRDGLRGFRYGLSTSFGLHLYDNGDAYADLRSRYRWGQVHDFLDIVGVADPTGIADGINAGLFAYQGDYVNASIRAIAIIPYVGDFAKGSNLIKPVKAALTDAELLQKAATKAEAAIGGVGRFKGTAKHTYANDLLKRYQKIYGDRGLEFNYYFNNNVLSGPGNRGFLDVVNHNTKTIYDFKFGEAVMSNKQFLKYSRNFEGYSIQIIRP